MSDDWFFEKFALIADAPGAVERMRGLVMWSAFSGAFSDEPRDQPMPEKWAIEGTPTLPPIPSSWSWQRGSDVFDVIRGVSYTKGDSSDTPVDGSFPILRANNIGRGINFNELVYVRAGNIRDEQFVRPGDILIAMSSGSKRLVGKAAPIVTEFQGGFGAFCGVIRNKSNVPDTVLARYFESPQYTSWVTSAGRGIGINNLSKGDLNSLPIPTPPLAEQKRIVTRVDELMGICDALESQQQERDLRKSVLVRSSLSRFAEAPTPENLGYLFHTSYDIPPSELRKSILTLAIQGKLVPFDTEGTKQTVGEHIDFQNGFAFKSQWFTATGTRLCRNVNVGHGFLDWKESVSIDEKVARDFQRFALCEGDIVLSLDRPLIATGLKIASVRQEDLPSLLLQRVARLTPKHEQLSRSYIFLWLNSTAFVDCIDPGRSNGVPHISTRQVQQLAFSVPPLAEQHRIVAKVDQLMSLVDELERQQEASREKATKLLDAIVHEMTIGGQGIAATLES